MPARLPWRLPTVAPSLLPARCLAQMPFAWKWRLAGLIASLNLRGDAVFRELLVTNLALCFPDWSNAQRLALARAHAQEQAFALIDRFRIWGLGAEALRRSVQIENAGLLQRVVGHHPLVLLCPHFVGVDVVIQRLALEGPAMSLHRPSPRRAFEDFRMQARQRFHPQHLLPVGAPLLPLVRRLQAGLPLFMSPDLDCGADAAVFAPFFGVPAATARSTAWCAARTAARVVPVSVKRVQDQRYVVTLHEPLPALPRDAAEGTQVINAAIEALVRETPEHYLWTQPRFATRPPGQAPFYSAPVLTVAQQRYGSRVA